MDEAQYFLEQIKNFSYFIYALIFIGAMFEFLLWHKLNRIEKLLLKEKEVSSSNEYKETGVTK